MKKVIVLVLLVLVVSYSLIAYTLADEYLSLAEEVFTPVSAPIDSPLPLSNRLPKLPESLWLELDDYFYADYTSFDQLVAIGRFDIQNRYRVLLVGIRGYSMAVGQFDYDVAYLIDLPSGRLTDQIIYWSREETPDNFPDQSGNWLSGIRVSERLGSIQPDGTTRVSSKVSRLVQSDTDTDGTSWTLVNSIDMGTRTYSISSQGRWVE
jgi:hypothetical protein